MKNGSASIRAVWVMVGLGLTALTAGPASAASDTQIRFNVPQPFRVGSRVFDAGVITVHDISAFTPNTSILEVWVNGICLGMVTALRSVTEDPPARTEALFRRDDDGRLELIGFRLTGRPTGTTYRFPETPIALARTSAHTDFPSTISPLTARLAASSSESFSTVSTSSGWRSERVRCSSSAR
jgi:hypothetical protein